MANHIAEVAVGEYDDDDEILTCLAELFAEPEPEVAVGEYDDDILTCLAKLFAEPEPEVPDYWAKVRARESAKKKKKGTGKRDTPLNSEQAKRKKKMDALKKREKQISNSRERQISKS